MGGGARVNQVLAALEGIGYNTNVISYDGTGALAFSRLHLSIKSKLVKLSLPQKVPKILKLVAIPFLIAVGFLSASKSAVVITHSPGITSGFVGLMVSRLRGGKLIVDFTDLKDNDTPQSVHDLVLRSAVLVFAVSRRLERSARDVGADNVVYLPTFIDLSLFPPGKQDGAAIRDSLGLGQRDRVLGYFGSFSRVEGLPVLLDAFTTVIRQLPRVKLMIVGSRNVGGTDDVGRIVQELGLQDNVLLVPAQPYARVPALMRAVDLLVAPKVEAPENEAADPVKMYEYLASGIPCVISLVGEVARTVQQAQAAFTVKPGDPRSLSETITLAFSDSPRAAAYAARGRRLIEDSYSMERATVEIRRAFGDIGIHGPIEETDGFVAWNVTPTSRTNRRHRR